MENMIYDNEDSNRYQLQRSQTPQTTSRKSEVIRKEGDPKLLILTLQAFDIETTDDSGIVPKAAHESASRQVVRKHLFCTSIFRIPRPPMSLGWHGMFHLAN